MVFTRTEKLRRQEAERKRYQKKKNGEAMRYKAPPAPKVIPKTQMASKYNFRPLPGRPGGGDRIPADNIIEGSSLAAGGGVTSSSSAKINDNSNDSGPSSSTMPSFLDNDFGNNFNSNNPGPSSSTVPSNFDNDFDNDFDNNFNFAGRQTSPNDEPPFAAGPEVTPTQSSSEADKSTLNSNITVSSTQSSLLTAIGNESDRSSSNVSEQEKAAGDHQQILKPYETSGSSLSTDASFTFGMTTTSEDEATQVADGESEVTLREEGLVIDQRDYVNRFLIDYRRAISPPHYPDREIIEFSSMSSMSTASITERDEEINVELSPRKYKTTVAPLVISQIDKKAYDETVEKYAALWENMRRYWRAVRELSEEREAIIKELQYHLSKSKDYTIEQAKRINAMVELIERDLNSIIPVCPKWKVSYQKDSDKKIIIHKGFIYKKMDDCYMCRFGKKDIRMRCEAVIYVNDSGILIEGSLAHHNHRGTEIYKEDIPLPFATPITLSRAKPNGEGIAKFKNVMEFLDKILDDVKKWGAHAILCYNNVEMLRQSINDLEPAQYFNIGEQEQFCAKHAVADAKNLLKSIRLDKL